MLLLLLLCRPNPGLLLLLLLLLPRQRLQLQLRLAGWGPRVGAGQGGAPPTGTWGVEAMQATRRETAVAVAAGSAGQ